MSVCERLVSVLGKLDLNYSSQGSHSLIQYLKLIKKRVKWDCSIVVRVRIGTSVCVIKNYETVIWFLVSESNFKNQLFLTTDGKLIIIKCRIIFSILQPLNNTLPPLYKITYRQQIGKWFQIYTTTNFSILVLSPF